MGWLKSLTKPFQKILDPILPESVKKAASKMSILGDANPFAGIQNKDNGAAAPAAAPAALDVSTVSDDELNAEAQKRMAKLGKYFTSPLGVLNGASTGAQRTFS